ncbi:MULTISPECIES: fumarylacetoacetate hydrolase family protein [unclassified Chelatococcus]|uniref:fumarylacetoacetate hydrolase family protein n=1 Tax=unclassified Chelatococcus TaxID=2638111 RepID=UPI001BCB56DF|nr:MULTISPECIES: fumarylacetoacetate hydrolase family protein [unclassified Chelatococcus]CAH1655113.1 Fumarylpyruvate hydrolase [Hyphomicrobiales bacterium]MBS7740333.1 fumarylacetoacetate hydrolase family protein [Chelatococcus sp. HY11]MBX3547158.1 fumarylacetoacetate hydrolase family protein [Chelatococcus sp.]MCO5078424.1 fumarylacetoacetate hydrolase family protein [Chelatococcus sp.]CAH1685190.1 Fumarylpyruvate hydrolase [Hyphomicrobiales bacterium]
MADASSTIEYVVKPPALPTLPVKGTDARFPVRRIYCVGRNFAAHAIEMGHDPNKEPPFFFQKNPDNVLLPDTGFPYPPQSNDVHFEIEMVVALGAGGRDIPVERALELVFGYAVGLDMTRRDLQGKAKDLGRPWEVGKAFEHSAPCGPIVPSSLIGHPAAGAIWLDVNGERRQTGDLNQMIWKVPEAIAYLSGLFTLAPGDLIFSGTPAGVGAIKPGDVMKGHVDGVGDIEVKVV